MQDLIVAALQTDSTRVLRSLESESQRKVMRQQTQCLEAHNVKTPLLCGYGGI